MIPGLDGRDAKDFHGIGLAPDGLPPGRHHLDAFSQGFTQRRGGQDLTGPGQAAEPRGEIDRVTDHRIFHFFLGTDVARHDRAGVDADAHRCEQGVSLQAGLF